MKRITFLLALFATGLSVTRAASHLTNSVAANRILVIDPSSMPVGAGKATLIIGALRRTDGVYSGDYKIKVFPYFLKNEKGRLAILVSDESLAEVYKGKSTPITGTATTSGKGGKTRPIAAMAMPVGRDRGNLKLWFTAGSRKMIFEPSYHFTDDSMASVPPPRASASLAAGRPCRMPASELQGRAAAASLTKKIAGSSRCAVPVKRIPPPARTVETYAGADPQLEHQW
jgi:hypothetical protein